MSETEIRGAAFFAVFALCVLGILSVTLIILNVIDKYMYYGVFCG